MTSRTTVLLVMVITQTSVSSVPTEHSITKTVAQSTGDFAIPVFDPPFTVPGDKITFDVVADIKGGAARTSRCTLTRLATSLLSVLRTAAVLTVSSYGVQIALPARDFDFCQQRSQSTLVSSLSPLTAQSLSSTHTQGQERSTLLTSGSKREVRTLT